MPVEHCPFFQAGCSTPAAGFSLWQQAILNSDQGSQYTTKAWEELLVKYDIKISMDGRGRCKDNIWIERFWRTIKQEYIYPNPAETVGELRSGIGYFIKFYNYKRPHQSLDKLLPAVKYGIVALKYVNCLAMSANKFTFAERNLKKSSLRYSKLINLNTI